MWLIDKTNFLARVEMFLNMKTHLGYEIFPESSKMKKIVQTISKFLIPFSICIFLTKLYYKYSGGPFLHLKLDENCEKGCIQEKRGY